MDNYKEEFKRIRGETRKWLLPGDRITFAAKFGITKSYITNILSGLAAGKKNNERLLEMHERAMKNKKMLEETRIEKQI